MNDVRTVQDRAQVHAGSESAGEAAPRQVEIAAQAGEPLQHRRTKAVGAVAGGAVSVGAVAFGACAMGATAIGALAIGRIAIGFLGLRRGRIKTLRVDEMTIGRLHVRELVIDDSRGR